MSNQIFVLLPSYTPHPNNSPNSFTVQLPKTLDLSSGNWVCGMHSISYVYSWPQLGTLESQHIVTHFHLGPKVIIPVPTLSFETPEQLESSLLPSILLELEKTFKLRKEFNKSLQRPKRSINTTAKEPEKAPDPVPNPIETSYKQGSLFKNYPDLYKK